MSIPFKEINAAALSQSRSLLQEWFPAGRWHGREFVVGNLYGDAGESLSINADTGQWADFATDHRGGDLISLAAAALYRGDQAEAAREIGKRLGVLQIGAFGTLNPTAQPAEPRPAPEQPRKPVWRSLTPPHGEPDPPITGWDSVHVYRDAHGRRLRYILRKEATDGGRKRFSQLTYGELDGVLGWHYRSANEPRCLYGLDRLATMPDAPVILCEGEKAADAAQALFQDRPCISWSGGTASVDRNDWTPLGGRRVVIWPDNDEPGQKVAEQLVTLLRPLVADLWLLRVDDIFDRDRAGGDAADVSPADPLAWARERLTRAPLPADEIPPDAPPMSDEEIEALAGPFDLKERPLFAEPVDFFGDDQLGAPVLEPRHIPAPLWDFVADTAARMGVDPTAVALGALVACASVMDDHWAVQPKRLDYTWTERPRIWGAIVGDPSILKTPVISACTRPIDKLEAEARAQHDVLMRQWKTDAAAAKKANEPAPPEPRMRRYMVEGTTIEALSEILRTDDGARFDAPCHKVLSRHDEMSEFFGGLDRYKSGGSGTGDRGAYLRLYQGNRYTVDRIGRGSFAVPNWSACFLGGIQPGPIQRIARDAADDGLLQRFIYCVPAGQQKGADQAPNHSAMQCYERLFPALVALHPAKAVDGDFYPALVLHADAHFHREEIDSLAQAMSAMPDTSSRLKAAFGKWPGLFGRLCLIFHLIAAADQRAAGSGAVMPTVISDATAAMVASFMREIVLPHLLRAEALMFASDQTGHARWIAGYILSHGLERIAVRDVVMSYKPLRPPETRRELDAVMASLVSVSWLEPEEPSNPAKGITAWTVNPLVHARFAERARVETERRAKAKEQIAAAVERHRKSAA